MVTRALTRFRSLPRLVRILWLFAVYEAPSVTLKALGA
jgi:hypothetical protein